MSIVITDDMVAKAQRVLREKTTAVAPGASVDEEDLARSMLEAAMENVNTIGQWWLGAAITHPEADLIFVVKKKKPGDLIPGFFLLRGDPSDADAFQQLPHNIDFRWGKDGQISAFTASKIGVGG